MDSETLLQEISEYCRRVGMAESTFGRLAVNDGKFVSRLKYGGRITTETLTRVRTYMAEHQSRGQAKPLVLPRVQPSTPLTASTASAAPPLPVRNGNLPTTSAASAALPATVAENPEK